MTSRNLRQLAEAVLFETFGEEPQPGHIRYGMHDRPAESNPSTTMPLQPDPLASADSLLNLPPVDDPDYFPTSVSELKLAMYAISENVPPEDIEQLFRVVRDKVNELSADPKVANKMAEAIVKGGGYFGEDDFEEFDELEDVEKGAAASFEAADEEAISLEDMALVLDKSVSGVNQYVARILKKVRTLSEDPRLGTAIEQAAADYARYMAKWLEDPAVETDLMTNLDELRNLDGFRYYLNDVMLEPALAEMRREGLQKASKKLESLGLPPTALEIVTRTVKNQLTGRSKPDMRAIQKALVRTFPEGADKAYNDYLRMASDIEAAAEPPEGALAIVALAVYNTTSESKKKTAFISAIEKEDDLNIG